MRIPVARASMALKQIGKTDTDRLVSALFAGAMHLGKAAEPSEYIAAYDACLALAKARGKTAPEAEGLQEPTEARDQDSARDLPTTDRLRKAFEEVKFEEGAALLAGVPLDIDLPADFLFYAAACLGSAGEVQIGIALMKRAAIAGFTRFYCLFHLGLFEEKRGEAINSACYFTASLIDNPEREDVFSHLERVAPNIELAILKQAQAGTQSIELGQQAVQLGTEKLRLGKAGAAACYFIAALAFDPGQEQAQAQLLELAPEVPLDVLLGTAAQPPDLSFGSGLATSGSGVGADIERLRALCNAAQYREALAVISDVDLRSAEAPDLLFYAGVCLGSVGREREAIELLKRAVAGGYGRFWCAYHLGLFEEKCGKAAEAAYYYTVSLILDPKRTDVYDHLGRVAHDLDLTSLHAAQAGKPTNAVAADAANLAAEQRKNGNIGAAAYYFTTALALAPEDYGVRSRLLELAPGISLDILTAIDTDRLVAEFESKLVVSATDSDSLARQLSVVEYYSGYLRYRRSIIAPIEKLFRDAVAIPNVRLDPLCRLYDLIYFLYWQTSSGIEEMRGFGEGVAASFAAAIRGGVGCADLPSIARRLAENEPLRLGYLSESANGGEGNAVGPFIDRILGGLARHFPGKYRPVLYAWRGDDEDFLASLPASGILIRRFEAETIEARVAAVASAIAEDEIDVLLTDVNAALPTVLFERRAAPVQIFCQFGLPFWPIENIDGVFRLEGYNPRIDGFDPAKCFTMGLGPWDMAALAPPVDAGKVAAERAGFPQDKRLIGTYGRLAKITPSFLAMIAGILARLPQAAVLIGGTGDSGPIRDFIAANGLGERLILADRFVDGHLWGHILELFLDTSPEGGVACREMMAKGRPVVSLRSLWSDQERVGMLVADDATSYVDIVSRLIEDAEFYEEACRATDSFVALQPQERDYAAAIDNAISAVVERVRNEARPACRTNRNVILERVVCRPILDELKHAAPSRVEQVDFGADGAPVEAATVDELLYLPALHLQIWRGHIVPDEANIDGDAFPELKENIRTGAVRLTGPLDIDASEEEVCVLSNLYSNNFFHFFEELYKVTILERNGFRGRYVLSPYGDRHYPGLPPFATEFLELLGIREDRILMCQRPTLFRSAWFTTRFPSEQTIPYAKVFFALRAALIDAATRIAPGLGPRLYLERYPKRVVVNREEVRECVDRYGFTTVDMGKLPVAHQIAAAHQAEILLGTHGSGMLHCAFMKEKSTVIECFSPQYMDFFILDHCHLLQHRYFQIVALNRAEGPFAYKYGGDVAINCHHLELVLKSVIDEGLH